MSRTSGSKLLLTVVPIAAEELVEPDEVGPAAEVRALGDQHFLDELEVVDDHAVRAAQADAVDVAIDFAERGERFEGRVVAAQEVQTPEDRQWSRSRRVRALLVGPREPPHDNQHTQGNESEHIRSV